MSNRYETSIPRRSPVYGYAAVASSQPLASAAGIEVLLQGGNAADAAVAIGAALAVTEPCSNGLGGDLIGLAYISNKVTSILGNGRAPAELAESHFPLKSKTHGSTVTVPGLVRAWADISARNGKLALSTVLKPAIRLARTGFPVGPRVACAWKSYSADVLDPDCDLMPPPRAGQVFRNQHLADVLERIAQNGADAFYTGEIAERVCDAVRAQEGSLSTSDLASHRTRFENAISTTYRGLQIHESAPPTHGAAALLALNIAEQFDIATMERGSDGHLHIMIECARLAFAETSATICDPDACRDRTAELLTKCFAKQRAAEIQYTRCMVPEGGSLPSGGTVQFCVVDESGDAFSIVQSNYIGFGSGIVPNCCGFSMNNRCLGFSSDSAHPNAAAGNKRPYHTIIPGMITDKDAAFRAAFGVMGSYMQPQGHMQIVSAIVDHGVDAQEAVDAIRFRVTGQFSAVEGAPDDEVLFPENVSSDVLKALQNRGHVTHIVKNVHQFGCAQVIIRDPATGVVEAGSDSRADGIAVALPKFNRL